MLSILYTRAKAGTAVSRVKAPDSSSHRVQNYNRSKRLMGDLRQACCDPQMVRDQAEVSSSKRRSMQQIMSDLALKAFNSFDNTMRGLLQARMLAACCAGFKDKGQGDDAPLPNLASSLFTL